MIADILILFALLLANGVFAMTEIAVVSARRARLQSLADAGDAGAAAALALAIEPNQFLSTVQVGITLVGIMAGAFGGSKLSADLAVILAQWPWVGAHAQPLSVAIVIGSITYFSLVIGELVPKRLAMLRPETIARKMALPMMGLSRLASPVVWFLGWSTDRLLGLFGLQPAADQAVSKDDVAGMVREGVLAGTLQPAESEMVEGVLGLGQLHVCDLMTPRPRMVWLQKDDLHEALRHKVVEGNHTYFPVYEGDRDNLVGVVSIKAIYARLAEGRPIILGEIMEAPLIVPEHQSAMQLLETFKQSGVHVAFAVDEFGSIAGMVTTTDLLEAIVGELPALDQRAAAQVRRRPDGSWLVDAMMDIEEVAQNVPDFPLPEDSGGTFQTLAGFVFSKLERVPREGDHCEHGPWKLEVLDMDGQRIDKVLLIPKKP